MAITFLGSVNGIDTPKPTVTRTVTTFSQIKNESTKASPIPSTTTKNIQVSTSINNDIIKPKYLQDKSIVYKSSGYVKDLLGEGN